MNIFMVDRDPVVAAQSLPDRHIVKMPVETVQMLVSACLRHDIQPKVITKAGTHHKGGYHKHPCTVWAGDTSQNALWLLQHGFALCHEYTKRYGKVHFAEGQLRQLQAYVTQIPAGPFTEPAQAMPDECKHADFTVAYQNCIRYKLVDRPGTFVWAKGTPMPSWLSNPRGTVMHDALEFFLAVA